MEGTPTFGMYPLPLAGASTSTPLRRPIEDDDMASVASESVVSRGARYRAMDGDGSSVAPSEAGDSVISARSLAYRSSAVEVDSGDEDFDDQMEAAADKDLEPPLKYERLSAELRSIAVEEKATALAVHPRLLVVGTSWGSVHIFDALGHAKNAEFKMHGHSVGVSQISVDHKGEFIASCSGVDGRVLVSGLCTSQHNLDMVLNRKVNAVALDPLFAKSGYGRRLLTGDDSRVIMHEKTYFNRYKQTPLGSPTDGPITCIKWRGYFAAWCCRRGVVVYDVTQERIISIIKYDTPLPPNPDPQDRLSGQFVTRLAWSNQYTLFVTQGDSVKVCSIKKRPEPQEQLRHLDLPDHYVSIKSAFRLRKFWICGIAPKDGGGGSGGRGGGRGGGGGGHSKHVLLLTVSKEDKSRPPEMMLVEPHQKSFSLVSIDLLPLSGYEQFTPHDYNVEFCLEDKHYFVMCPTEVVMGKPRDIDDNIEWLVDHEDYSKALMVAESNVRMLDRHSVVSVGKMYLDVLLESEQYKEAAKLCVRIFKNDKRLWQEEAVVKFARLRQLRVLAPLIPKGNFNQVRLDKKYYETILISLINNPEDNDTFLELIRGSWSPDLYEISVLIDAVLEALISGGGGGDSGGGGSGGSDVASQEQSHQTLMRALATLYTYSNRYDKALEIYLQLNHKDVFSLIRKRDLFDVIHNRIGDLMELDAREAVKLFMEYMEKLEPELVVAKLEEAGVGRHLYLYLDALLDKDREESRRYHGRLVGLYADFDQKKLLPFLNSSEHYDMGAALEDCRQRCMTRESIFILAKMGDTRQALQLILAELHSIDEAIEFCKEHDDSDLWEDLIEYSIDKPAFIHILLLNIGTHVDPRVLISRIQPGLQIPNLKESLATIMHDYRLQKKLQKQCKKILESDCYTLIAKQEEIQKRGVSVGVEGNKCGGCGGKIVDPSATPKNPPPPRSIGSSPFVEVHSQVGDVVVFMCRHTFHTQCLSVADGGATCDLCVVKR